jgi:hypothetical protein
VASERTDTGENLSWSNARRCEVPLDTPLEGPAISRLTGGKMGVRETETCPGGMFV